MPQQPENVMFREEFSAWNGSESQFERILNILTQQMTDLIPAHVEGATAEARVEVDRARTTYAQTAADYERARASGDELSVSLRRPGLEFAQRELERAESRLEDARAEAERAGLLAVVLTSGNSQRETAGTPDDILTYLRGREIDSLSVSVPASRLPGYSISLSAGKASGIKVRVASSNDRWATAAFTYLRDEVRRNVPWWRFARNLALLYVVYLVATGLVLWNVFDIIAKLTVEGGQFDTTAGTWAWTAVGIGAITGGVYFAGRTRQWLSAFEIVPDGVVRKRGPLRLLGSTVGAIAVSVGANWVSSILFQPGG